MKFDISSMDCNSCYKYCYFITTIIVWLPFIPEVSVGKNCRKSNAGENLKLEPRQQNNNYIAYIPDATDRNNKKRIGRPVEQSFHSKILNTDCNLRMKL